MPNSYLSLADLKTLIDKTSSNDDAQFLLLAPSVSRQIDEYCNRFFFSKDSQTMYFSGENRTQLTVPDILSVTTLKVDTTLDGTYDETIAATDYSLWPWNDDPKVAIELLPKSTSLYIFPSGPKNIEVVGSFGFKETLWSQTETLTLANSSVVTATVSASGHNISPGHTIKCESEQMYVEAVPTGTTLTVERGVNGTTAAAHTAKAMSIYQYPRDLQLAVASQIKRWQAQAEAGFSDAVGAADGGTLLYSRELHPEVKSILKSYVTIGHLQAV